MTTNADIYQGVTDRILECLNNGVVPWYKPWAVSSPRNLSRGHVYKGINQILRESHLLVRERSKRRAWWRAGLLHAE